MHVKEPQSAEYEMIRPGQILFTYLHLAADRQQTDALIRRKSVNIAYETIQRQTDRFPCSCP